MWTLKEFDQSRAKRFFLGFIQGVNPKALAVMELVTREVFLASPAPGITRDELLARVTATVQENTGINPTPAQMQTAGENLDRVLDMFSQPADPDNPDDAVVIRANAAGRYIYVLDGGRDPNDPDIGQRVVWDHYSKQQDQEPNTISL